MSPTPDDDPIRGSDDLPAPRRSEAELLGLIGSNVDRLARQRRTRVRVAIVGTAVVMLLAVVTIGAVASGRHATTDLDTADQPDTTTSTGPSSTTTTAPDTTTTVAASSPSSPTTTSAPTPTIPATVPTTPPPTVLDFGPPCDAANFTADVTTTKSSYAIGEPVGVTKVLRNHGPECTNGLGVDVWKGCYGTRVRDSSGAIVSVQQVLCTADLYLGPVPVGWSGTTTDTWDQTACPSPQDCPRGQVPAGTYTIDLATDLFHSTDGTPTTVTIG